MKQQIERIIKQALTIEMVMCCILMILVPAVVYFAAPVYIQMRKLPVEGIHSMRMLGLEFAGFMLLKFLVNWRAKKLNLKWLIPAIISCIPPLMYLATTWATAELSVESLIGMSVYTTLVFGPSICIFSGGLFYCSSLWLERKATQQRL